MAFSIVVAGVRGWRKEGFRGAKKKTVITLMKRMLRYSAIKIKANVPLLYSVLKPETNSDSPSAKSNGVRFVSARMVANHMQARGGRTSTGRKPRFVDRSVKEVVASITKGARRIRTILTS